MAHFARVENNVVTEVVVVGNADCAGGEFPESESAGQAFLASCGMAGHWLQTSFNNTFRGRFAGKGFIYNADLDEFVIPQE